MNYLWKLEYTEYTYTDAGVHKEEHVGYVASETTDLREIYEKRQVRRGDNKLYSYIEIETATFLGGVELLKEQKTPLSKKEV